VRGDDGFGLRNGGVDAGDNRVDLSLESEEFRREFFGSVAITEGSSSLRQGYGWQAPLTDFAHRLVFARAR